MPCYATITSTARYVPEIEVTNDMLREQFKHIPDFVDKMEASSGIKTRWRVPENWATSDVALPAAKLALERAGKKPEDVDLIILGTDSRTTSRLQRRSFFSTSWAPRMPARLSRLRLRFVSHRRLSAGSGIIAANPGIKTVLVIGVYLMHKLTLPTDPMIFFYGDGAGAAIL